MNIPKFTKINQICVRKTISHLILILVKWKTSTFDIRFRQKKKAKTVASLSRLCHMAKICANKVIKSRECHQKSQSITKIIIKILNNNDVAPKIIYALFAYRCECRALGSHSRIPFICRFYTLRIFTQTNAMLRKLIFYCPLTWLPVVAG